MNSVIDSATDDGELTSAFLELVGDSALARPEMILPALVRAGASLTARTAGGLTGYHVAAYRGSSASVKALNRFYFIPPGEPLPAGSVVRHGDRIHAVAGYNPMHLAAAFNPDPCAVTAILDDADDRVQDWIDRPVAVGHEASMTPLHLAIKMNGVSEVVARLLKRGSNAHARIAQGQTPALLLAAAHGAEKFELLLAAGADPRSVDQAGNTALHFAVASYDHDLVHRVAGLGVNPHRRNRNGQTPLDWWIEASTYDQNRSIAERTAVTRALLEVGAVLGPGHHPLRRAVELGQLAIARVLIDEACPREARASPTETTAAVRGEETATTSDGTCIVDLATGDHPDRIAKLIAEGVEPDTPNPEGTRALSIAAARGQVRSVQALIDGGADINHRNTGTGMAALDEACRSGHADVVGLLANAGATVDAVHPTTGCAALHHAIDPFVVEALCSAGADPNIRNREGDTPLHSHVYTQLADVVEALLRCGADPNAKRNDGETPLSLALDRCNGPVIVRALLRAGADANEKLPGWCRTPLAKAIAKTNLDVIRLLIEHGAAPNGRTAADDNSRPLLALAADHSQWQELIPVLLSAGADPNDTDAANVAGNVLHAIGNRPGAAEVVRIALAAGANPHQRTHDGDTALHTACLLSGSDPDVVTVLVDAGIDPDDRGGGASSLELAVDQPHALVMARALLAMGAKPTFDDAKGMSVFTKIQYGHVELRVIRLLVDARDRWDIADGKTPVFELGTRESEQDIAIARLLSSAGVAITLASSQPLYAAIRQGDLGAVRFLVTCGADLSSPFGDEVEPYGDTPIMAAVRHGADHRFVRALLDAGVNMHGGTRLDMTALHLAARSAQPDVVRMLLGAQHSLVAGSGALSPDTQLSLPIHYAAAAGCVENLRVLIEAGSPISVTNRERATPLDEAAAGGHTAAVQLLLDAGADPTAGCGVLAEAVAGGSREAVEILIAAGAPIDAVGERRRGMTALALASATEDIKLVELLLAAGADSRPKRPGDTDPLVAAVNGTARRDIIAALIAAGAVVSSDLLLLTAMRDDSETMRVLLNHGADPNSGDSMGQTPLHVAARQSSDPQVISTLLAAGAKIELEDDCCQTALHVAARFSHTPAVVDALIVAAEHALAEDTMRSEILKNAARNPHLGVIRSIVNGLSTAVGRGEPC